LQAVAFSVLTSGKTLVTVMVINLLVQVYSLKCTALIFACSLQEQIHNFLCERMGFCYYYLIKIAVETGNVVFSKHFSR